MSESTMLRSTAWNVLKPALVGVSAVVAGYAVVALLSELVQEVWLGGVSYGHSSTWVLALAGVFTPAGGVLGGVVAGAIGRRFPLAHGLALSAVIVAETTYLFTTHRVDGPLWFEASAGATLAAAVVFGSWLAGRWLRKTVTDLSR
jgi:cation transport ATPase